MTMNKTFSYFSVLIIIFSAIMLNGCSSARRSEPIKGPLRLSTAELAEGKENFDRYCNSCHPGGEAGLGPALNNKSVVPSFIIKFQVRNGLGKMPSFSREQLPPDELDKIVKYIKALQKHG